MADEFNLECNKLRGNANCTVIAGWWIWGPNGQINSKLALLQRVDWRQSKQTISDIGLWMVIDPHKTTSTRTWVDLDSSLPIWNAMWTSKQMDNGANRQWNDAAVAARNKETGLLRKIHTCGESRPYPVPIRLDCSFQKFGLFVGNL